MKDGKTHARVIGFVGLVIGASVAQGQQSQSNGPQMATAEAPELQEVVVTGYRKSLQDATNAKRDNITISDTVFAEDIGKFPDLNIAESLNRVPGVQLARDVNGEGVNVSIRGLGTNFTKVTLNGAEVSVASSGKLDAQNQNREVDLDLFPTELFTKLSVYKSPTADLVEGGAAGIVDMRAARPFDNPGTHVNYTLQEGFGNPGRNFSPRAALMGSWTNDTFGVLAGVAAVRNKETVNGYETVGWTNPGFTYGMCGIPVPPKSSAGAVAPGCNLTGGNGWAFPGSGTAANGIGTVPAGAGGGLVAGTPITTAYLQQLNPGLTQEQLSDATIPRLGRDVYINGERNRVAEIFSAEYRPSDQFHAYLDTMFSKAVRDFSRIDMDLVGRSGGIIPENEQIDSNGVVTSATFANAQYFLEDRPYTEDVTFLNLNPGFHWQPISWIGVDGQANLNRSSYENQSPTILINSPLGQGVTVNYTNTGGNTPNTVNTNFNVNDPNAGWTWTGGRVNMQDERRDTQNRGAHLDVQFLNDPVNFKVGGAFNDSYRTILALDNSLAWSDAICGGNTPFQPQPAPQPACTGGAGSLVPQSALASYISPGPAGFIQVNTNKIFQASNYYALNAEAPLASGAATGASSGGIHEKTYGAYVEFNGQTEIAGNTLRGNIGLREIKTIQTVSGPYIVAGIVQQAPWENLISDYDHALPSLNVQYNMKDNIVLRFAASKTLTRPDPSQMVPGTVFSDPSAQTASQGNPKLQPYISNNLDLGGEWYTGAEGYVSLDLFGKKIKGFTQFGVTDEPFNDLNIDYNSLTLQQQNAIMQRGGPNSATVQVQQQVNVPGALTIKGLEANWVQPFGRFVQQLDGFGFTANWTHITQTVSDSSITPALGISPNTYNTTLYYDKNDISVRISWNWQAKQIATVPNQNGIPLASLFNDAYGQLDMSASYTLSALPTKPQIVLNATNLTSSTIRQYFEFPNEVYSFYKPGYQILLGIRGKF